MEPATFATLWYAGLVVLVMDTGSPNICANLVDIMIQDAAEAYTDPGTAAELADSMFPTNEFTATCETERLPTDLIYLKDTE